MRQALLKHIASLQASTGHKTGAFGCQVYFDAAQEFAKLHGLIFAEASLPPDFGIFVWKHEDEAFRMPC